MENATKKQTSMQRNFSGKGAAGKKIFMELFFLLLSMLEGKDWASLAQIW